MLIFNILSAVRTGLEPATPGVTGRYSNQTELPHQGMNVVKFPINGDRLKRFSFWVCKDNAFS